ncbi:unnamed protein product, partial [Mycena citricolor]
RNHMDLKLRDVHVLITGASGGIGLETARLFLAQGAKVTAHYNTSSSPLDALVEEYGTARVARTQANLVNEDDVDHLFSSASNTLGPVQIVVINHGIWPTADEPVESMSLDRWRTTLDVNLTSAFLVSRAYLKQLRNASEDQQHTASMLFIGSTAGKYGEAGHADYAASKSALMYGLVLSLKNEIVKIAPRGRVNAVGPGWVKTPMAEAALKDPQVVYRAVATTPLKKVAETWDIATQVVMLSSPSVSGHVTGQVVMVEGGMEGRLLNQMTANGIQAY